MTAAAVLLLYGRYVPPSPLPEYRPVIQTIVSVTLPPDGRVVIDFGEGSTREYASRADVTGELAQIDQQYLRALLVARWAALNPAVDNPAVINGTSLEINMASALSPIVFAQE